MQRLTRIPKHWLLVTALVLIAASAAAVAYAADTNTVYACVDNENGNARVVAAGLFGAKQGDCRQDETKVSWNIVGPQGSQGVQGPAGPIGSQGLAGPTGSPGVSGHEIIRVTSAFDSTSAKVVSAICSPGKKVLGGGFNIQGFPEGGTWTAPPPEVVVQTSAPNADNSWRVGAEETHPTDGDWRVMAFAICANVAP